MSVLDYLKWSFGFINSSYNEINDVKEPECVIYLCSTHFIKNIIKQANKTIANEKAKRAIIFCFTLLQNSSSLQQIEDYLVNIYNIFNSRYLDRVTTFSIGIIKDEVLFRRLEHTNINEIPDKKKYTEIFTLKNENSDTNTDETENTLIKMSPFSIHFESFFTKIKLSFEISKRKNESNKILELNEYFSPELFKIIASYLHLLPLWSGIVITPIQTKNQNMFSTPKNRLTNNIVENWFMNLKNFIILNEKKFVSEYTSLLFKCLKKKYFSGFFDLCEEERKKKINLKTLNNRKEIWRRKLETKKREKGFYYKHLKNLGTIEFEYVEEEFVKSMTDFNRTFNFREEPTIEIALDQSFCDVFDEIFLVYDLIGYEKNYEKIVEIFNSYRSSIDQLISFLKEKTPSYSRIKNLPMDNSFLVLLQAHNLNDCSALVTKGDGNCFYYSISTIILSNPEYYKLIKIGALFTILKYKVFFEDILKKKAYFENYNDFFLNLSGKNNWANELMILATVIMFSRPLICLCYNEIKRVPYSNMFNLDFENDESIFIGFKENHFVALCGEFDINFLKSKAMNYYGEFVESFENIQKTVLKN
ncbi:unnamed protein product [Brachionus calyciflorus]|uniref:OTU domain-containing protein n=1 Tax=Brachionus calyciflorus TaxID=104777 RepID=A0A814CAI6_9BILA|nr:unnamed protein product [Brachionus calyciflorus]